MPVLAGPISLTTTASTGRETERWPSQDSWSSEQHGSRTPPLSNEVSSRISSWYTRRPYMARIIQLSTRYPAFFQPLDCNLCLVPNLRCDASHLGKTSLVHGYQYLPPANEPPFCYVGIHPMSGRCRCCDVLTGPGTGAIDR